MKKNRKKQKTAQKPKNQSSVKKSTRKKSRMFPKARKEFKTLNGLAHVARQ
jgi:hypothetical protein